MRPDPLTQRAAEALNLLAADPTAVAQLRAYVDELRQGSDPESRKAGECWAAALGAMVASHRSGESHHFDRAIQLLSLGLDAWLARLQTQVRGSGTGEPTVDGVATALCSVSENARRVLRGDESSMRRMEEELTALRKQLRAVKVIADTSP